MKLQHQYIALISGIFLIMGCETSIDLSKLGASPNVASTAEAAPHVTNPGVDPQTPEIDPILSDTFDVDTLNLEGAQDHVRHITIKLPWYKKKSACPHSEYYAAGNEHYDGALYGVQHTYVEFDRSEIKKIRMIVETPTTGIRKVVAETFPKEEFLESSGDRWMLFFRGYDSSSTNMEYLGWRDETGKVHLIALLLFHKTVQNGKEQLWIRVVTEPLVLYGSASPLLAKMFFQNRFFCQYLGNQFFYFYLHFER